MTRAQRALACASASFPCLPLELSCAGHLRRDHVSGLDEVPRHYGPSATPVARVAKGVEQICCPPVLVPVRRCCKHRYPETGSTHGFQPGDRRI